MENPADFHAVAPDAIEQVMVFHAVVAAPIYKIVPRLASQAYGVLRDLFQRFFNMAAVDTNLIYAPLIKGVVVNAVQILGRKRRETIFPHP